MTEKSHKSGMVSWELFNDLYENQYDIFRKLKFFVKAGKAGKNEALALEMIEDLVTRREMDLERIRHNGLQERVGVENAAVRQISDRVLLEGSGKSDNDRSLAVIASREPVRTSYWGRLKSRILG